MPIYYYLCEDNGQTIEVEHTMEARLSTWGEVCYVAQIPLGDTDPMAGVERVIKRAPGISVPVFDSELKGRGFTKLVRREDGVYENVTAADGEGRYMKRGEKDGVPHLHKKITD